MSGSSIEDAVGGSPLLPLESLNFVKAYVPTVDKARDTIIQEMESMVVNGLADLVRLDLLRDASLAQVSIVACLTDESRINRFSPRRYKPHTIFGFYLI